MSRIEAPILIIAFNRPEVTKETFEYIRNAQPTKLYIAIDGPREEVPGENEKVNDVKEILSKVDWECELHQKFNSTNQGAEITVSSAISWVLDQEEYVIVLEDDIVAPLSFLRFAQEMLIKYKDQPRIATVTGSNFTPMPFPEDADYCFAKYGHSWGWATWRRAWKGFDLGLSVDLKHMKMDFLQTITNSEREAKYLQNQFQKLINNGPGNSTWDYTANYFLRTKDKLSIIPKTNLTSNIGVFGLHAKGETEHHFRKYDDEFTVTKHPSKIEYFKEYDKFHFENYIAPKKSIFKKIKNKVKRTFKAI